MILFIDDEKRRMESWVEALRDEGFEVVQVGSVDAALDIAEDRARRPLIEAVIWDMMMPPKSRLGSDETRAGLATGAKLALRLRELLPRTPLIPGMTAARMGAGMAQPTATTAVKGRSPKS